MPASYRKLPSLAATAVADTTGLNPGNWTLTFDTTQVTNLTQFECYHLAINGPIGFGMAVFINRAKWDHTAQGWKNSWDPSEPMILIQGDQVYLMWEAPTTATPTPTATAWFRYDQALYG